MNITKVKWDLNNKVSEIKLQKEELNTKLHEEIESLIDDELDMYDSGKCKPTVIEFFRGMYYLTFAKYTDPIAYKMAHRIVHKIKSRQIK